MLEAYRAHVAEREAEGIVPKPLSAESGLGTIPSASRSATWAL